MARKHIPMIYFLIALQARALQLYLNEALAKILSCKFYLVSKNTYLQNILERLILMFFLKFRFFLYVELQGNEDQRLSNYVKINLFKKTNEMCRDIYLHEAAAPGLLFGKI